MSEITVTWLQGVLRSATRGERPHATNLDVLKSTFEHGATHLKLIFGAVAAGLFGLSASLLTALITDLVGDRTLGSKAETVDGVTTITNIVASASFDYSHLALITAQAFVLLFGGAALAFNRVLHTRLERTYTNAVAVYFFLDRVTP